MYYISEDDIDDPDSIEEINDNETPMDSSFATATSIFEGSTSSKSEPHGVARKSTTQVKPKQPTIVTRRKFAAQTDNLKSLRDSHQEFLKNFNPETSAREKRKLRRKINNANKFVYDERGLHYETGLDRCDCLRATCPGCHFPCRKCGSFKCGPHCRVNRKFTYESIQYHGCDEVTENPLHNFGQK